MSERRAKHMADITPDEEGLFIIPELEDTVDLGGTQVDAKKDYLMPNRVYDVLKWIAIVLLPVLGWAVGELAPDYGVDPYKYVHFIDVVGTVIGVLIGASQISSMGRAKRDWE